MYIDITMFPEPLSCKYAWLHTGVGTIHGGQGGPNNYINQGRPNHPPPPTNVGAIKGTLTVKMDDLIHILAIFATICFGSSTIFNFKNFYCFTHITNRYVHTLCIHVLCHRKKSPPPPAPIIKHHPTPLFHNNYINKSKFA